MRESKKDKRDHDYGRVHRKNRELREKIIHESAPYWKEYCQFLEDTRNDGSKETLYEREEMYKAYKDDVAKDLKEELDKLWEEARTQRQRNWERINKLQPLIEKYCEHE